MVPATTKNRTFSLQVTFNYVIICTIFSLHTYIREASVNSLLTLEQVFIYPLLTLEQVFIYPLLTLEQVFIYPLLTLEQVFIYPLLTLEQVFIYPLLTLEQVFIYPLLTLEQVFIYPLLTLEQVFIYPLLTLEQVFIYPLLTLEQVFIYPLLTLEQVFIEQHQFVDSLPRRVNQTIPHGSFQVKYLSPCKTSHIRKALMNCFLHLFISIKNPTMSTMSESSSVWTIFPMQKINNFIYQMVI